MSEFKAIETQEALNNIISERLSRQESKIRAEYEGYKTPDEVTEALNASRSEIETLKSDYETKLKDIEAKHGEHMQEIESLTKQVNDSKINELKTRIAITSGLGLDWVDDLKGSTEEEITASAEKFRSRISATIPSSPARNTEAKEAEDGVMAAFRKLNPNIKF